MKSLLTTLYKADFVMVLCGYIWEFPDRFMLKSPISPFKQCVQPYTPFFPLLKGIPKIIQGQSSNHHWNYVDHSNRVAR